jgi:hypothetical protein
LLDRLWDQPANDLNGRRPAKTEKGEGDGGAGSPAPPNDGNREGRRSAFLREVAAYENAVRNARRREFFPLEIGHAMFDAVEALGGLPGPEPLTTCLNLRDRSQPCGTVKGWRNRQKDILVTDIPKLRAWGEDELKKLEKYDVFLAHNSKDKPAVRNLARLLIDHARRAWVWPAPQSKAFA